jgi:hypothetical protein
MKLTAIFLFLLLCLLHINFPHDFLVQMDTHAPLATDRFEITSRLFDHKELTHSLTVEKYKDKVQTIKKNTHHHTHHNIIQI